MRTWKATTRLPKDDAFLKKGIPSPLTIFFISSLITYPSSVDIVYYTPSKCWTAKEKPVSASRKVIYFFMIRSAPILVNVLCYFYWTMKYRSPAYAPGISLPSPSTLIA
jgi:ABC-type arginine/histidine transport system permease subunit